MRKLTVTARQFQTFLFPQIASSSASNIDAWETGLRLMKVLKDPALTIEVPLTDDEKASRDRGEAVYPYRKLIEDEADFILKEDEYGLLKKNITAYKAAVSLLAAEDFSGLLEAIQQAPEVEPDAKAKAEAVVGKLSPKEA